MSIIIHYRSYEDFQNKMIITLSFIESFTNIIFCQNKMTNALNHSLYMIFINIFFKTHPSVFLHWDLNGSLQTNTNIKPINITDLNKKSMKIFTILFDYHIKEGRTTKF